MDKILIRKCPHDWHACPAGHPGMWGAGATPEEAERSLRRSWPEIPAGLPVEVDPDDTAERDRIRAVTLVTVMMHERSRP
jgi:hypothetical protein